MTGYFSPIDYRIIAGYLLGLVGLGSYLKGRHRLASTPCIVGDRELPWWALGFSGMASFLDMAGTAIIVAFLFLLDGLARDHYSVSDQLPRISTASVESANREGGRPLASAVNADPAWANLLASCFRSC